MQQFDKGIFKLLAVLLTGTVILTLFLKFSTSDYLSFSDSAKSADIARNLILGLGYNGTFSFWSSGILDLSQKLAFPSPWLPPLMPFSIALAFKLFGISDFAVILTSAFYFFLLVVFVFLLGKKLFGSLVGILSAVAVAVSSDFLHYATNGSSEAAFSFEIAGAAYFLTLKKKWATMTAAVFGVLLYFTRPQAFIYIAGLLLYWLLINFKTKKALASFGIALFAGFLIDYYVMPNFAGKYFLYSVTGRGIGTAVQVSAGGSASDSLRGLTDPVVGSWLLPVLKKTFYHLYNFYKLLPQIINPYLFAFFAFGLLVWSKDKVENSFKISAIFMFVLTLLVAAVSIPFFRYIHPVVPLIYIVAVATIVKIFTSQISNFKQITIIKHAISKNAYLIFSSCALVFVLSVGQTLGVVFLDSRYERNTHNPGKPPVYVVLSKILKENTKSSDFIVTNLDTWGSWYGERRTIWFPTEPGQLIDSAPGEIPFDAIYLTSYLIDDQSYFMGENWRLIFDNPGNPDKWTCEKCGEIVKEFELKNIFKISADDNYERLNSNAVLLVKKQ